MDKYIVENSGYLKNLNYFQVMSSLIQDLMLQIQLHYMVQHGIPALTKGSEQLDPASVESTRKIDNIRVQVERIIGTVQQCYPIMSATGVLPKGYVSHKIQNGIILDSIARTCCALNDVTEGVVPFV